ncbi:hypothetical protein CBL_03330 [Carabus blaptoides fortunei]
MAYEFQHRNLLRLAKRGSLPPPDPSSRGGASQHGTCLKYARTHTPENIRQFSTIPAIIHRPLELAAGRLCIGGSGKQRQQQREVNSGKQWNHNTEACICCGCLVTSKRVETKTGTKQLKPD